MKKTLRHAAGLAIVCLVLLCAGTVRAEGADAPVDYAGAVRLDMASETVKQEVSVYAFVDGDTTHFNVPSSVAASGVLKARYLAINTPETTNKVEAYGKKAAEFTREKLSAATSIIIESDDGQWNPDSTGGRYLVWVWYRTEETQDYRNLNVEILQNGLAIANSAANNRYGDVCTAAIAQARAQELNLYSDEPDPDFYYGDAIELTLKELRCNPDAYEGKKVAFEGVITMNDSNTVYVEDYDPETGLYYGVGVYYGYSLNGQGLNILKVGNRSRIVGTFQYYALGDAYQVAGLTYRMMQPDDPENLQKISDGHTPAYVLTDPDTFVNGRVEVALDGQTQTFDYAALAQATSLEMRNLQVREAYRQEDVGSSGHGSLTLLCEADGVPVQVRVNPLYDAQHALVSEEAFLGRTIDVRGIADAHQGTYQIRVFTAGGITIHP